jgi:hypothetical protein
MEISVEWPQLLDKQGLKTSYTIFAVNYKQKRY